MKRKRHSLAVRLWHWINAAALIVLFMSGLNISNAHRFLYWGKSGSNPADAWTSVIRFPGWATLPQHYDLAGARDWHNLAAWAFAAALLSIWIVMIVRGHFWRNIALDRAEWSVSAFAADIRAHLRGQFEHGDAKYNALQKVAYGLVYGVMLPMMVFTGLAISPGFEPAAPWLVDFLGGRQSARSLHFIFAWSVFGFFVVHIVMVLLSGPIRQITSMITGNRTEENQHG